ncbi:cytochrome P450 9e2 [Microplitis demolitor]|uniref:cytochrome P450 9e2 n=1 Tax=Microplitis demolitor TaxID=69319 RepID=UPI0004400404|nr:cytochrome P450 9e2 [Microplitis demolitor]
MDNNYSYTIVLTLIVVLIFIIYYYLTEKQKYWEKRGIPVIKSSVPFIGNIWPVLSMRKNIAQLYEEFYKSASQHSMVGLYNVGEPELLIRDPELIKIIFQTNFTSFDKNGIEINPELDPLVSRNPFFLQGEEWKQERSILTNNMSSGKLKNMSLSVRDVCIEFKNYINKEMKSSGDGKSIEIDSQELFARFTSAFIAKAGFGIDGNCFSNNSDNFFEIAKLMFNPTSLDAFKTMIVSVIPSLNNIIKAHFISPKIDHYFRGIVNDILESRKKNNTRGNDFVQHLSDTYKYNEFNSNDNEKKDILLSIAGHASSFLIDGYLTSSLTLTFITYHIASNPDVQNKVRKEIKETLNKYNNEITYDAIQDLKYMDLVIKESMRLSPAASILQKKCTKEFKLIGFDNVECTVEPGTKITIPLEELHKDKKYWQDSDKFDPERFIDENKSNQQKFVYLPFGGGRRVCVGQRMALLQMKGALTILLDNFSLEISQKTKQPLVWCCNSLLNSPEGGVWMIIKPL